MNSIRELQDLLLSQHAESLLSMPLLKKATTIVVLKQYRFHKRLTIGLYEAAMTGSGKVKNPLQEINPFDAVLKAEGKEEIKYYSAVSRFQNNPTAQASPLDTEALRTITANPFALRFFYHNPEFSENVVAGALKEVSIGSHIDDIQLTVNKTDHYFEIGVQLTIDGKPYSLDKVEVLYEYFVLIDSTIHLLNNFHFLKVVRFFKQYAAGWRLPESKFREFEEHVLQQLKDQVRVVYSYAESIASVKPEGQTESLQEEKLIYLSDLNQYVIINPVMKYGEVEIPVLSKRQIYVHDAAGRLIAFPRNEAAEVAFIAFLLRQYPHFAEQLHTDLTHFYLPKEDFLEESWFLNAFEQWQEQDITVLGFNSLKQNKLNGNKATISVKVVSGINWFNTQIDVRFGKQKASLKKLQQAARNKSKYITLDDGTTGILPQEWLGKFSDYFSAGEVAEEQLVTPRINFAALKQLYAPEQLDDEVKEQLALYEAGIRQCDSIEPVPVPKDLKARLRDYQKHGLNWLNFLDKYNFGGCLADDMGLGKTLQILALILLQREKAKQNTNLVVVPTSLLFNWQSEVQKFAPSIKLLTLHGTERKRSTKEFDAYEIILTSYGTLLSDVAYLKNYPFNYIFLDESQNIKNVDSQRYYAVKRLQSRNKIVITGTPIENNTFDLFAQLSFACPGLLGSKQAFKDLFSTPIDKFKNTKRANELQQKVAPFILRRTKQEVAKELPAKTEMVLYCPMGEDQRKVYEENEQELRDFIANRTVEELGKNSMHVLKGLTRLRQICNSPLLLPDDKVQGESSSKLEMLLEQIETKSSHHKILVFSQFVSMLELIRKELLSRNIGFAYLTGGTQNRERVVQEFQQDSNIRVFLISLKAGGVGLNLTAADYVYLIDPWWNPAVENQAIDRAFRIGQDKNVVAVRLICPHTIEEKMMKLQDTKKELVSDLIKTNNAYNLFTKDEWLSLLNP